MINLLLIFPIMWGLYMLTIIVPYVIIIAWGFIGPKLNFMLDITKAFMRGVTK